MSKELFLVPKMETSWEEIEAGITSIGGTEVDPPSDEYSQSWKVGGTWVHLFEDEGLHVEQLIVEGKKNDEVAQKLREALPIYEPSDMPALFADVEDEDDLSERLGILAAVAPPTADPSLVALFHQALTHEDPLVRERAALTATVPAWPELREDIERLAREDEDDDVRESAAVALNDFKKKR